MRSRLLRSSLVVRILGTAILAFCLLNPFPGLDIDWYKSDLGDGFPLENCLANAKACIYRRSIFSLVSVNKRSFSLYLLHRLIDTVCKQICETFSCLSAGFVGFCENETKMVDKSCSLLCQNCYYHIIYDATDVFIRWLSFLQICI